MPPHRLPSLMRDMDPRPHVDSAGGLGYRLPASSLEGWGSTRLTLRPHLPLGLGRAHAVGEGIR